jgi:hypothetical protein
MVMVQIFLINEWLSNGPAEFDAAKYVVLVPSRDGGQEG